MIATDTDLRWIVERIVALADTDRVYLFGSYAKGTAHDGSDLDLLVVCPSPLRRPHRGKEVIAALRAFPIPFHVLFYTPQEFAEELTDPTSFLAAAMAAARLLYERAGGIADDVSKSVHHDGPAAPPAGALARRRVRLPGRRSEQ